MERRRGLGTTPAARARRAPRTARSSTATDDGATRGRRRPAHHRHRHAVYATPPLCDPPQNLRNERNPPAARRAPGPRTFHTAARARALGRPSGRLPAWGAPGGPKAAPQPRARAAKCARTYSSNARASTVACKHSICLRRKGGGVGRAVTLAARVVQTRCERARAYCTCRERECVRGGMYVRSWSRNPSQQGKARAGGRHAPRRAAARAARCPRCARHARRGRGHPRSPQITPDHPRSHQRVLVPRRAAI